MSPLRDQVEAHAALCRTALAAGKPRPDWRGGDLTGANLIGADLIGADLSRANLIRADLSRTAGAFSLGTPNDWHAHAWLRDGYLSIRVGCQELRLDEARSYWAGKDNRREVLAAVEYAASVAVIRGWATEAMFGDGFKQKELF